MTTLVMLPPQTALTRKWASRVAAELPALDVVVAEDRREAWRHLPGASAAFGTLDPQLISVATELRWLQAPMAAPPPGFFFPELAAHPVQVTNFRGIYNDHVATHAVALLLALSRGLHHYLRQQESAEWSRHTADEDVLHLPGSTALVVGVGGIGAEIARLVHSFGARVLGVDPRRTEVPEGVEEMYRPDELDSLLPSADAILLTLPHTPESQGLIDTDRIARMQRGCLLVNIGRGPTVRLDAICSALRAGRLGGVGLDVFEEEPLPETHPLWREPRAILTPHVAVVGPHIDDRRLDVFRENARRFSTGLPLVNIVDKLLWY